MAAITSAVIGAAGLGLSAYQAIEGANRQKKYQRELNDYERQELKNAYENVKISTMGSDLLREENARTSANLIDASQLGGARTVIGAVPRVVGATNEINQNAAKMIDDQVMQREYAIAGDNARIEGITENRDIANIAGLSSQINAGREDMWAGFGSALSSAAYLGRGLKEMKGGNTIDTASASGKMGGTTSVDNSQKTSDMDYSSSDYFGEGTNSDLINKYGKRISTPTFKVSSPMTLTENNTRNSFFTESFDDMINKYNRTRY